jgi:hypothetical protein
MNARLFTRARFFSRFPTLLPLHPQANTQAASSCVNLNGTTRLSGKNRSQTAVSALFPSLWFASLMRFFFGVFHPSFLSVSRRKLPRAQT